MATIAGMPIAEGFFDVWIEQRRVKRARRHVFGGEFVEPFLIHGAEAEHADRHAGRTEAAEVFAAHDGFAFLTLSSPNCFFSAVARRFVSSGSLNSAGVPSEISTVGSGAPALAAAASALRRIASCSCWRTCGDRLRSVSCSRHSSEMMLCFVPAWIEPTVTTAGSVGFTSRLTIVCKSSTSLAAMTMGSMVVSGLGAVAAAAFDDDVDAVDVGEGVAGEVVDFAGRHVGRIVKCDGEIGAREACEEAVVDHGIGAAADFFGRLKNEDHRAGPIVAMAAR